MQKLREKSTNIEAICTIENPLTGLNVDHPKTHKEQPVLLIRILPLIMQFFFPMGDKTILTTVNDRRKYFWNAK